MSGNICELKIDKYWHAARKLYKGDTIAMEQDRLSNNGMWSEKVRQAAGDSILDDIDPEQPAPRTFISMSLERRLDLLNNIEIERQRFEFLSQRNPDNKALKQRAKELKDYSMRAQQLQDEVLVMSYLEYSFNSLSRAQETIKKMRNENSNDVSAAMRVLKEVDSLKILKDITMEFNTETEEGAKAQSYYNDLLKIGDVIYKDVLDLSRDYLANMLANNTTNKIYVEAQHIAEKEFKKTATYQNLPFKEKGPALREYVAKYLADNRDQIKMRSLDYYGEYVKKIVTDVETMEKAAPNTLINESIFSKIREEILLDLEIAKHETEVESMHLEVLDKNVNKSGVDTSNPLKKWESILIKDKKGWRLLDPKIKNSYLNKKQRRDNGDTKVPPYTPEELKWEKVLTNDAMEKMYNRLLDIATKSDFNYTSKGKLGLYIPSLEKNTYHKLKEGGVSGAISSLKEVWKITDKMQDLIGSEVTAFTGVDDRAVLSVPIYMRMEVKDEDRSFDLPTLMLMNYYNSKVFVSRLKNKDLIDSTLFVVENAKIKYTGFEAARKKARNQNNQTPWQENSIESGLYQKLQDIKESMIYGKGVKANPNAVKAVMISNRISSVINLAGNWIAGAASFSNNFFQNLESLISDSGVISRADAKKARGKYFKYIGGLTRDALNKQNPTSLLSNMYQFYNPGLESFDTPYKAENKSLFSRHASDLGTLFVTQRVSDSPAYSIVMMSYLETVKITNEKGEFLNAEGKVVANKSEAISMLDAHELHFNETGKFGLPDFAKANSLNGENSIENLKKITRIIQNYGTERFGAYGSLNKSSIQRTVLGSLFYSQRGFLIPILMQKWKGYSMVFSKDLLQDMTIDQRSVDETRGVTTEGTYIIGIKVLVDMIRSVKSAGGLLEARSSTLANLSSRDVAQFRRFQIEVIVLASLWAIAGALRKMGEDDDDEAKLAAAFFVRRLYAELRSPSSVGEFMRYLQQPTVTSATYQRILKLLEQGFTDIYAGELEIYESGIYKGDSKLKRKGIGLIPVVNQIERNYDWQRMYDYLEKM
jgi:hypothetical protein